MLKIMNQSLIVAMTATHSLFELLSVTERILTINLTGNAELRGLADLQTDLSRELLISSTINGQTRDP